LISFVVDGEDVNSGGDGLHPLLLPHQCTLGKKQPVSPLVYRMSGFLFKLLHRVILNSAILTQRDHSGEPKYIFVSGTFKLLRIT
jgi:hypothetical protein